MKPAVVSLDDADDRARLELVHPPGWSNPAPTGRYNLVVVGAGTAGLVTAAAAAGLGARVALVERHLMGGDCLNVGCVPSKAVIASGRAAAAVTGAAGLGVRVEGATVDFAAAMGRMRRLRAGIAEVDSAARFRELGVDVYFGDARFSSDREVEVDGTTLAFSRAVIATGARASVPPIPGLASAGYLTNEDVFDLVELPQRLVVLGAGPIGCELAQSFARLGATVTLLEMAPRILPRDDASAAEVVRAALAADGVDIVCGAAIDRVEADRSVIVGGRQFAADAILVATGRRPNTAELGLEAAGVKLDERGFVVTDDRLRSSCRRIFAAGDVCGRWQFTHAADAMARLVIKNALFFGRSRVADLVVPWVTYTEPELSQVGLTAAEAADQGIAIDTYEKSFAEVDRAIVDGACEGFVRVHTRRGTDCIVGATIVGAQAGELITPLVLAMTSGQGLGALASTIVPYPTRALALKAVGDGYNRSRLSPRIARFFGWLLARRR